MKLLRLEIPTTGGTVNHLVYIAPDGLENYRRYHHEPLTIAEVEGCGYSADGGWNPALCGNGIPCPEHGALVCDCGKAATRGCSSAGSFVCGAPVCEEHTYCWRHR